MKKIISVALISAGLVASANAQQSYQLPPNIANSIKIANSLGELTGDTKLACEAILCLSAPAAPAECAASLAKYFSIVAKTPHETLIKRQNFLALCPIIE